MTDPSNAGAADALTREIIVGKLLAIVDEMAIVLARASMSSVVYEVLDFACGICDAEGQLIAQTNGITLFTGTFSAQVRFIRTRFGDAMVPGDTFLTNDPFEGGTHACDFAVIRGQCSTTVPWSPTPSRLRICSMSAAPSPAACRPTRPRCSRRGCGCRASA